MDDNEIVWGRSANAAGARQPLIEHLQGVAQRAAEFGAAFGAAGFCRRAGLLHDVGKAAPEWQAYLAASEAGTWKGPRPDHKCAGAVLATEARDELGPVIIHGHHGGLGSVSGDLKPWLADHKDRPATRAALAWAKANLPAAPAGEAQPPAWATGRKLDIELFLRLAYSALVDADTLDAERHQLAGTQSQRNSTVDISALWDAFQRFAAASPRGAGVVQRVRDEVLDACRVAANQKPGLFRMTVPTGGGKTRSGLAFALQHAVANGLSRIIVAVPFTTITEQTAQVYREIFAGLGYTAVLEHHSAAHERAADRDGDGCSPAEEWQRLAAENWDAPLVVTTTVQLFESLFANKRNAMRKVHRLANSVIILDEAQALPVQLLDTILDGLTTLTANCRTSVVLSTATQPSFEAIPAFKAIVAREIVPGHAEHFAALRRVDWDWRTSEHHQWSEVAEWIRAERSSLTIVNTVRHAEELLEELDDPGAFHFSRKLCGAHRRHVLAHVKERLAAGEPCTVVATTVVEAGVDLDFPVVFRALAPVDSLIQAAGRCNREGKLQDRGRVIVFETHDGAAPPGAYKTGRDLARIFAGSEDLADPANVTAASKLYFGSLQTDQKKIQDVRRTYDFPKVARLFRMIDDDSYDVVVLWGTPEDKAMVEAAVARLRAKDPAVRQLMRALQPYIVAVRAREAPALKRNGWIDEIMPGLGMWSGGYGDRGLEAKAESLVF